MPRLRRRLDPNRHLRPRRQVSLTHFLPNLLTLGAICAGLTSIRFSIDGRLNEAVALILLAAILDALDGRLARVLRSESAIGAELDSLADFLNFGVATGLLVFLSAGHGSLGWIAVLIYVICCVMRLARFNVDARLPPPAASLGGLPGGFVGVPSPAGAILAMMPVFLDRALPKVDLPVAATAAWMVVVGLLMVSRLPTPSLKLLRIRWDTLPYLVILMVGTLAVLFTWPWWTLLAACLAYLLTLAWTLRRWRPASPTLTPAPTNGKTPPDAP